MTTNRGHMRKIRNVEQTSFSLGRILITSLVLMLTTMLLPTASITSMLSILLWRQNLKKN